MSENTELRFENDFELPYADTAGLKSNLSVRATFRLSEKTILALNIASNQLGVKQKSLFDHLMSDTNASETIARELKKSNQKNPGGIQKTFVISRKTLSILKKTANDHKASRDALVEFSIQRLKPIIEQEKSKLESRRHIAKKIKTAVESRKKLLDEATKKLGMEANPSRSQWTMPTLRPKGRCNHKCMVASRSFYHAPLALTADRESSPI